MHVCARVLRIVPLTLSCLFCFALHFLAKTGRASLRGARAAGVSAKQGQRACKGATCAFTTVLCWPRPLTNVRRLAPAGGGIRLPAHTALEPICFSSLSPQAPRSREEEEREVDRLQSELSGALAGLEESRQEVKTTHMELEATQALLSVMEDALAKAGQGVAGAAQGEAGAPGSGFTMRVVHPLPLALTPELASPASTGCSSVSRSAPVVPCSDAFGSPASILASSLQKAQQQRQAGTPSPRAIKSGEALSAALSEVERLNGLVKDLSSRLSDTHWQLAQATAPSASRPSVRRTSSVPPQLTPVRMHEEGEMEHVLTPGALQTHLSQVSLLFPFSSQCCGVLPPYLQLLY